MGDENIIKQYDYPEKLDHPRRQETRLNLCEDCGEPTPNKGYCDMCEARHTLIFTCPLGCYLPAQ